MAFKDFAKNMSRFKPTLKLVKSWSRRVFQDKSDRLLTELRSLERENPNDMRVKQKVAELQYRRGETEDAIATFQEIAAHYEREDFILKAVQAYRNILKIRPNMVDINLKLAALYKKMGLKTEASNQYRIAVSFYAAVGNRVKGMELSEELVRLDPSVENMSKLAEIYHAAGMVPEAVKQYELLAKEYRQRKQYDKLVHMYEMILPHRAQNQAILKDLCILYLRQQKPEKALRLIDQNGVGNDPTFVDLSGKAKLMIDALKRQKKRALPAG